MASDRGVRHCRDGGNNTRLRLVEVASIVSDDMQFENLENEQAVTPGSSRTPFARILIVGVEGNRQAYVDAFWPRGYCVLFAAPPTGALALADESARWNRSSDCSVRCPGCASVPNRCVVSPGFPARDAVPRYRSWRRAGYFVAERTAVT